MNVLQTADIVNLLVWLIMAIGASLVGLLIWIGKRIQTQVDALPAAVKDELEAMRTSLRSIEYDLRTQLTSLDRRTTKIETLQEVQHPKFGGSKNGD